MANQKETATVESVFSAAAGGKSLADLLRPGGQRSGFPLSGPVAWPARPARPPAAPLPSFPGLPPRAFVAEKGQPLRPRALKEEAPLSSQRGRPPLPQVLQLPTGELVRLPAVDVATPPALPILAQHLRQPAPLTDPTMAASLAAVLGELQPARAVPVPFTSINLPDPFENSQAMRLRHPPAEEPMPVNVTPRLPGKK